MMNLFKATLKYIIIKVLLLTGKQNKNNMNNKQKTKNKNTQKKV